MKGTDSFVSLIESHKKNKYLYDWNKKKTVICHPVFYHLLELMNEGIDLESFIKGISINGIEIENYGFFSRKEVEYYYKKYLLLKENGYFEKINSGERIVTRMTAEEVKRSLANAKQLTLEVTERCSLDCGYCGYGKFYSDYDKRKNIDMEPALAKRLIDDLVKLWDSPLNLSHDRNIYIGIYGGEPLLNSHLFR